MKKEISTEMRAFILEEANNDILHDKEDINFKNQMKVIAIELKKGKKVTTVIQGKLVSISLENGKSVIIDR